MKIHNNERQQIFKGHQQVLSEVLVSNQHEMMNDDWLI